MTKQEFKHTVFSLSELLFPMVSRMLGSTSKAEDAIQEIMIKLWHKRKQLSKHPNIKGFVVLTARNYCLDLLRKKKVLLEDSSDVLKLVKSTNEHLNLEWEELNKHITTILKTIPEQQKEVFIMRDIDGFEFDEIAAALQIKIPHVRVLLSRARKQISTTLEKTYRYERGKY